MLRASFRFRQSKRRMGLKFQSRVLSLPQNLTGAEDFSCRIPAAAFLSKISATMQPSPGDVVTVSGISYPGGYAPIISKPHWKKMGTAPLPTPKPVAIEQLMSGAEDSQRIEISGIVREAQITTMGYLKLNWLREDTGSVCMRQFHPVLIHKHWWAPKFR